MGREVKRVPVGFDWPIDKVWGGYVNPHGGCSNCEACDGSGYSSQAKFIRDQWYGYAAFNPSETGSEPLTIATPVVRAFAERSVASAPHFYGRGESAIIRESLRLASMWNTQWSHHLDVDDVAALIKADRLWDFTRVPINDEQREIVAVKIAGGSNSWLPFNNGYIPTPKEVNEWSISAMGHDSLNEYVCVKAKCERLGIPMSCDACNGTGTRWESSEAEAKYNAWERAEPPTGAAYQVWETVSKGSPISPAFEDPCELARWMVMNDTSVTSDTAYEQWMAFIAGEGWAPTMIANNHGTMSGVCAATEAP